MRNVLLVILAEIAIAAGGITMTLIHGVPFWVWPTITGVCLIALPVVAYGRNVVRALRGIKDALKDGPNGKELARLRAEIEALKEAKSGEKIVRAEVQPAEPTSPSADYIEACGIVDRYIYSAVLDARDGVKISIRQDFIDRFEKTTGAKLGPYEYNRELLHQWMQSNAARFLVENRGKMS